MKVLYATDGGAPAKQALGLLEHAATPAKAAITVVSVVGSEVEEIEEDVEPSAGAEAVLSAAQHLREAGFEVNEHLLRGRPGPAILEEIEKGGFEVAVLGAGNQSRFERLLLGSVSTKVLHASLSSVMIVHRFSDVASSLRVLFATDGSDDARRALEQMMSFMNPSSCQITVLSVAEHLMPQLTFPSPRIAHAKSAPTPEQEEEWTAAARETATAAAHKLEGAGFTTEAHAVLGAPVSRVLEEAREMKADLVVVGSRGLGAIERATLGSVSDQVVREAPATFVGPHRPELSRVPATRARSWPSGR